MANIIITYYNKNLSQKKIINIVTNIQTTSYRLPILADTETILRDLEQTGTWLWDPIILILCIVIIIIIIIIII
jgi:hypothetical protein